MRMQNITHVSEHKLILFYTLDQEAELMASNTLSVTQSVIPLCCFH